MSRFVLAFVISISFKVLVCFAKESSQDVYLLPANVYFNGQVGFNLNDLQSRSLDTNKQLKASELSGAAWLKRARSQIDLLMKRQAAKLRQSSPPEHFWTIKFTSAPFELHLQGLSFLARNYSFFSLNLLPSNIAQLISPPTSTTGEVAVYSRDLNVPADPELAFQTTSYMDESSFKANKENSWLYYDQMHSQIVQETLGTVRISVHWKRECCRRELTNALSSNVAKAATWTREQWLMRIGDSYQRLKRDDKALKFYNQLLDELDYNTHRKLVLEADAHRQIGKSYFNLAKHDKAIEHHSRALFTYERLLETPGAARHNGSMVDVMHKLGQTYYAIGRCEQEQERIARCLDSYKLSFDWYKRSTTQQQPQQAPQQQQHRAKTLNNMGVVLLQHAGYEKSLDNLQRSRELYANAIEHLKLSLSLKKRHKDDDSVGIARTLHNLGVAYHELGNYEKSLERLEPSMLAYEQAIEHLLLSLDMRRRLHISNSNGQQPKQPDHAAMANTLHHIGDTYYDMGNYEKSLERVERSAHMYAESVAYGNQSIEMKQRLYDGVYHVSIADTLHNVASTYHEWGNWAKSQERVSVALGHYAQAMRLFKRSLHIKERMFAPHTTAHYHPSTATTLYSMAVLEYDMGNCDKSRELASTRAHYTSAIEHLERAARIRRLVFAASAPLHHPRVAKSVFFRGAVLHQLANYEKSLENLDESLTLYEQALSHYNTFIDMKRKTYANTIGREHSTVATALHDMSEVYFDMGNHAKSRGYANDALDYYTRSTVSVQLALDIKRTFYPHHHPSTADTLHSIALAYHFLGHLVIAISFLFGYYSDIVFSFLLINS